jgi:hypothetical protein
LNWYITTENPDTLPNDEPSIERAEDEPEDFEPDQQLLEEAKTAAISLAAKLDGTSLITIQGHQEQPNGAGFKPGFVSVTVSLIDPTAHSL